MKTLFRLFLLLVATSYLVYTFIHSPKVENDVVCSKVEINFADSITDGFIDTNEVKQILMSAGQYPVDKHIDSVSGKNIVTSLLKNKYIKTADCYKTPKGVVHINLTQRKPIMAVLPEDGNAYYIDKEGAILPANKYLSYLTAVSGNISKEFAQKKLPALAQYIEANKFWKDQISQIYVTKGEKIDLYTRVGEDQVIHFGNTDSIDRKFRHLKAFYEKVLPEAGWNTYSEITVAYDNQIIGKRRTATKQPKKPLAKKTEKKQEEKH